MKFTFHILGLSHSKTHRDYVCDAFSTKVRLLCKMLTERGHTVYHYGTEGSNPICTENINVLSQETFLKSHNYDWKKDGFKIDANCEANKEFDKNAILEINKRVKKGDFLLCSFGIQHKIIADNCKLCIPVELGIGYENTFAPFRIFESYGWMHYIYGKEGKKLNPSFYDAVIPPYYDLNDYVFEKNPEDYFFFLARPIVLKGLEVAIKTCEVLNKKLIVAGQGQPPFKSKIMEFVGVVDIFQRAKYMSKAKATFIPSLYIEPGGQNQVESLLGGTPLITTDWGCFPDTNLHGLTGYRCRTLEQFIWAAKNISTIDRKFCRDYAVKNFSLERVVKKYEEYFDMLYKLHTNKEGWYQKNNERKNLTWLTKY